jgi:hypothetical protein
MSFTYSESLDTDLARVRFAIGDTESGAGVLPTGSNIPDATLNALIAREGSWGAAAAAACESLARTWSKIAASQSIGGRSESNQQVANFRQMAQDLRAQYGGAVGGLQAGVVALDFSAKGDDTVISEDD